MRDLRAPLSAIKTLLFEYGRETFSLESKMKEMTNSVEVGLLKGLVKDRHAVGHTVIEWIKSYEKGKE